jgi:hypothetical protein
MVSLRLLKELLVSNNVVSKIQVEKLGIPQEIHSQLQFARALNTVSDMPIQSL